MENEGKKGKENDNKYLGNREYIRLRGILTFQQRLLKIEIDLGFCGNKLNTYHKYRYLNIMMYRN